MNRCRRCHCRAAGRRSRRPCGIIRPGAWARQNDLYREVLRTDPRHADAWHFLGVLAHQGGRNEVGVDLIHQAIALNDGVPAFYNNLGNALKALGRWEEAVASYGRALMLKPDLVAAHYNIGLTRQAQGNLMEAVASYERALSLKPDYAEAHSNLGNALQAQGKLAEAVASYGRAIFVRPDYAEAHSNLGNVLKAQGKLKEAVASFERALAHRPDSGRGTPQPGPAFPGARKIERRRVLLRAGPGAQAGLRGGAPLSGQCTARARPGGGGAGVLPESPRIEA